MKALDQTSSVGPMMRTRVPNTSIRRACSNHSSPTAMVPFAAAKITSKNDSPLWTLASQRSSSISIAQPRSRKFAQDYRVIAGLAEDVEILGGARDAGIGAQRVASRQQERQSQAGQLAQRLGIEQFGVPRRRRRLG